jgi:hypothetical protein
MMQGVTAAHVQVASGGIADAPAAEAGRHTRSMAFLMLGRAMPGLSGVGAAFRRPDH